MVIYIYVLIVSISSELIETRENKILKVILVNHINTWSVIANRFEVNSLSIILKKNNIDEFSYYFNKNTINKIEWFKVGYMWYSIDLLIYLQNKPNYNFYLNLIFKIDIYLYRIDSYIFFKYNNWDLNFNMIKEFIDINKF